MKKSILILSALALLIACGKDDYQKGSAPEFTVPTVNTLDASDILAESATLSIKIVKAGDFPVIEYGVRYGESQDNLANSVIIWKEGTTIKNTEKNITGLSADTQYYYQAYARNTAGDAYGKVVKFRTLNGTASVKILSISNIQAYTASLKGQVQNDGGSEILERGFVLSDKSTPEKEVAYACGAGLGEFTLDTLVYVPGKTYTAKAYAKNNVGTYFSTPNEFTTRDGSVLLSTMAAADITIHTASVGGDITDDGGTEISERGICYGTSSDPVVAGQKVVDTKAGIGKFNCVISELTPGVRYYVRAYAVNSTGTYYGSNIQFTTLSGSAQLSTASPADITLYTATLGGNVSEDNGAPITERGVCYSTSKNPTVTSTVSKAVSSGLGSYTCKVSSLTRKTTYYVRSYAVNSVGTYYGDEKSFTTLSGEPTMSTSSTYAITATSASSGGSITADNGAEVTERGICYATTQNPTTSNNVVKAATPGTGSFVCNMSGLVNNTTYYVRSYAVNSIGTHYGAQQSFKTSSGVAAVTTSNPSNITLYKATCGGNVTGDGGAPITEKGICYSTSVNPTTSSKKVVATSTGLGAYTCELTGLDFNTTYFVRAYAVNSAGTYYGAQVSFATNSGIAVLSTSAASSIMAKTALLGGEITSDGGATISERGVCYSTSQNPTISSDKVKASSAGTGQYNCSVSGLTPNTTYYVRSYATNETGTFYGAQINFKTQSGVATMTTVDVSDIALKSAVSGGDITDDGGAVITERGICFSKSSTPTTSDTKVKASSGGLGTYSCDMSGLEYNTTYYVRSYAINEVGTSYGAAKSFKTLDGTAVLTTLDPSNITLTSASAGGSISSDGGSTITSRGICYATTANPTISNSKVQASTGGTGKFSCDITGLDHNTIYYVRAYAENEIGVFYGDQKSFTTVNGFAVLSTDAVTSITASSAVSGGNITEDNGATVSERGICYGTTQNPTTDSNVVKASSAGKGAFTCTMSSLLNNTTYYVRAYAKNSFGIYYGQQETFKTKDGVAILAASSATDIAVASAKVSANISSDGGSTVTARGICYSTAENPTIEDNRVGASTTGTGEFSCVLSGLTRNTAYYARAYATNSCGTFYSNSISFSTLNGEVVLTTVAASDITYYSATAGGNISTDGGSPVSARGVCYSTSSNPTVENAKVADTSSGTGVYSCALTGLDHETVYYIRAYATNAYGTYYGDEKTFTTQSNMIAGHEFVDLGLPSGTLWASCNIGATNPEDYGDYYSWGVSVTQSDYAWNTYASTLGVTTYLNTFCGSIKDPLRFYVYPNTTAGCISGTNFDTATNLWGSEWQMPTYDQFMELISLCTSSFDTDKSSVIIAYENGNKLYIPVAGCHYNSTSRDEGSKGFYWTGSSNKESVSHAYSQGFSMIGGLHSAVGSTGRNYGMSIRPVHSPNDGKVRVNTIAASGILATSATVSGNVTWDGGYPVTARGICYSTSPTPTTSNSKVAASTSGKGMFSCNLTGLTKNKTYYVRAYATNGKGTFYGDEQTFTTWDGNYVDQSGVNRGTGIPINQTVGSVTKTVYWAPVNLGYDTKYPYGKLYQWGRNAGQGYGTKSTTTVPDTDIDEAGVTVKISKSTATGSTVLSKPDANTFYTLAETTVANDWYSATRESQIDVEWNEISKSDYIGNPCPEGWRVPSLDELKGLAENYTVGTKDGLKGNYFKGASSSLSNSQSLFLPYAGYRSSSSNGKVISRTGTGMYWSSVTNTSGAHRLSFNSTSFNTVSASRGNAMTVRCVRE